MPIVRLLPPPLLLALCLAHPICLQSQDLVGRWELSAISDRRGQVGPPAAAQMTLLITDTSAHLLSGKVRIWSDPNQPPEQRPCGPLVGQRRDKTHVTFMLFATGDSIPAMTMEAEVRPDSMFIQGETRDGASVLAAGLWFVFVRVSTDSRLGCLTRA
jgi:hypothetical protein